MLPLKLFLFIKALHLAFVIFWMAGIFYLPRLFVYHAKAIPGGEADAMLKVMEAKLLKFIMRPASIVVFITACGLFYHYGGFHGPIWLHIKLCLGLSIYAFEGFLIKCHKNFLKNANHYPEKFYRIINEIPSAVVLAIVFLAFLKIK